MKKCPIQASVRPHVQAWLEDERVRRGLSFSATVDAVLFEAMQASTAGAQHRGRLAAPQLSDDLDTVRRILDKKDGD